MAACRLTSAGARADRIAAELSAVGLALPGTLIKRHVGHTYTSNCY
jgi:hypothetical protein